MTQENNTKPEEALDSENIFDEFTNDQDIKDEIHETEKKQEKDMFYYLKKLSSFFFIVNIISFIALLLGSFYIYIQENEIKKEYSYLSPICSIFLGNNDITPGTCYGVSAILEEYKTILATSIDDQAQEIFPILGDIYSIENFNLSKKVSFLLEKNDTRLRPLEILSSFDELKNIYSTEDKGEISCYDISISQDILSITCDAFSSDWNTDIVTIIDDARKLLPGGGTSISRASSFINFIENYRESGFVVNSKPQTFSATSVQLGPYTQKTSFSLELQYITEKTLIF